MNACDLCGATDAPSTGRCALRNRERCLAMACNRLSQERNALRAEVERLRDERASLRRKLRAVGRVDAKRLRQVLSALGYVVQGRLLFWRMSTGELSPSFGMSWTNALAEIESTVARVKRTERRHAVARERRAADMGRLREALAEIERLRAMFGDVDADVAAHVAGREADELREIAWRHCFEVERLRKELDELRASHIVLRPVPRSEWEDM